MNTLTLSPWIARIILVLMAPIGAGAIWLTRKYASASIESLPAQERMVRQLSIDVLLAAHIALVIVVALLPVKQFRALRVALAILSLGIWAFDGVGMYAARYGIMDKAETTLTSAAQRYEDKQRTMKDLQASAAARRDQANREWANQRWTDATRGRDLASKESAHAIRLQAELDAMPDGSGTTEVRVYGGAENARLRAGAEALLVSLVLVASCVLVGLTLRELLQQSAARRPAQAAASALAAKPAPAPAVSLAKSEPMHSPKVSYGAMLAGAGIAGLGAAAAPPAHSAPAVPVAPAAPADVVRVSVQRVAPAIAPVAPAQVQAALAPTPKAQGVQGAQAVAPAAPVTTPAQVQKRSAQVRKKVPAGLRDAIMAKEVQPAQKAIRVFTGCNQDVAIYWLEMLGKEGVIEPKASGRGWQVKVTA